MRRALGRSRLLSRRQITSSKANSGSARSWARTNAQLTRPNNAPVVKNTVHPGETPRLRIRAARTMYANATETAARIATSEYPPTRHTV
jgi:hypothetical protein